MYRNTVLDEWGKKKYMKSLILGGILFIVRENLAKAQSPGTRTTTAGVITILPAIFSLVRKDCDFLSPTWIKNAKKKKAQNYSVTKPTVHNGRKIFSGVEDS